MSYKVLFRYSEGICDFAGREFETEQETTHYADEALSSPWIISFRVVPADTSLMDAIAECRP